MNKFKVPLWMGFALIGVMVSSCRMLSSGPNLDDSIRVLQQKLGNYPPVFASPAQASETKKLLVDTIAEVQGQIKNNPEDPQLEWRLGECYRLEYNLDRPDAWALAEHYLRRALVLDPNLIQPRLSIGTLYLNSGVESASRAEKEFQIAVKLADDKSLPEAYKGLFLSYYYQAKFKEAVAEADRYLALVPKDQSVGKMRAMAVSNLPKESSPR